VELVRALVEQGADVHAKDIDGYGRPLHHGRRLLCFNRMVRCVHMRALCRMTALHLSSKEGHTETVDCLVKTILESGADVHDKDNKGYGFELHCAGRIETGSVLCPLCI
jgi:hypothetical protein